MVIQQEHLYGTFHLHNELFQTTEQHSVDSVTFCNFPKGINKVLSINQLHEYRSLESNLNFALSGSYFPATFLSSGLVCGADLPLLSLQILQLPLGLLQLLPSLHSFTLQSCDLMAVLLVQSLRILTLKTNN